MAGRARPVLHRECCDGDCHLARQNCLLQSPDSVNVITSGCCGRDCQSPRPGTQTIHNVSLVLVPDDWWRHPYTDTTAPSAPFWKCRTQVLTEAPWLLIIDKTGVRVTNTVETNTLQQQNALRPRCHRSPELFFFCCNIAHVHQAASPLYKDVTHNPSAHRLVHPGSWGRSAECSCIYTGGPRGPGNHQQLRSEFAFQQQVKKQKTVVQ